MKNAFLILIFFIPLLSYSQTKGVGYSSVYSLKDKVNAFNEALFNAQENAAINSGGNIGRVSTDVGTDVISENNMRKTEASYNSKKIDLRSRMIKAVVTTIGDPTCDTIWLKSKHYKVKITGEFNVNHEQVDFLLPD